MNLLQRNDLEVSQEEIIARLSREVARLRLENEQLRQIAKLNLDTVKGMQR